MKITSVKSRKIDKKLETLRGFNEVAKYSMNIEKNRRKLYEGIKENLKTGEMCYNYYWEYTFYKDDISPSSQSTY